eukprot:scaffold13105_cov89-Isochrysis_galbana.AAC.2
MATAALLKAGGRVLEASERLTARVAAGSGRSCTLSLCLEAAVLRYWWEPVCSMGARGGRFTRRGVCPTLSV